MASMRDSLKTSSTSGVRGWIDRAAWAVQIVFVIAAVGVVGYAASPLLRNAPKPATFPSTMEQVNWADADSSVYCLACHRNVAPAAGVRDVQHGHSQNVALNAAQLQAVQAMGTTTGTDGVLICMSCHTLDQKGHPHMLAESLAGSKLCKGCHAEQFTTVGSPHDLRITAPEETNRFGQTAESGGPCSACHLAHHYAREAEPSELDPDGRCVTCHQIGRAAEKHARPTMEHPDAHCVVCHNPHDNTHKHFMKKPAAEVCSDCHGEYAAGPAKGMHPLGEMAYAVPQSLIDAGAQTFGNARQLTCLVCHSTHSSTNKPLLIMPADTNDLCLSCHEKELAAKGADGRVPKHGQSPKLTAEQRAVVEGRGGRVGANGELLCVSCHKVHHGRTPADLLSFQPAAEDGCAACHTDQAGVIGTAHDLRITRPTDKNLAGQTALAGGPCSACHMAHGSARAAKPTEADVSGHCTTCHGELGDEAEMPAWHAGHPGTNCVACHDPHEHRTSSFLFQKPADLCRACHAEQYDLAGGPHDPAHRPQAWADKLPAGSSEQQGSCLACHAAHGKKGTGLFSFATDTDAYHDSACLHCHADTAWDVSTDVAAIHPQRISPDQKRVPLALVPHDDKGNLRMGCRTCHNPHGGAEPGHLARVKAGEPTASLCTHCHDDKKLIEMTGHATDKLAAAGFETESCKPCHAMHANPADAWGQMLSPRFLTQSAPMADAAASQPAESTTQPERTLVDRYGHESAVPCLVCHHPGGPAPVREVATHPPVTLVNIVKPDEPGYMPLFGPDGKVSVNGQITCRTCHLSHGQTELLRQAAAKGDTDAQHSARMQLRPFVAPNLCTQCHGAQARLKFLFFHNLEQRGKTN